MLDYTAFSHGQIKSKMWLCDEIERFLPSPSRIAILGGWYGLVAFLLLTRDVKKIDYIRSYDIDPRVESIADKINNAWVCDKWRFKAITADANDVDLSEFNVVINTSAEHVVSRKWFDNIQDQLVIIQSTDQIHDDNELHDYSFSLTELKQKYAMLSFYEGEIGFEYPDKSFNRYMLIGRKF